MCYNFHIQENIKNTILIIYSKVYSLDCGTEEVFKCKGYPGELNRNHFMDLYEGKTLDLLVTKCITS